MLKHAYQKTFLFVVSPCPPLRLNPYGLHATAPSYFRAWASRWQLVLGTLLPGHRPASHDLGSLCLLAGPLPPLRPCPLLLWAGFDTRLCSPSRICRPRFTRPRVGIGACRSLGARCRRHVLPVPSLGPSPSGVEHVTPPFAPCSVTSVCPPRSLASRRLFCLLPGLLIFHAC